MSDYLLSTFGVGLSDPPCVLAASLYNIPSYDEYNLSLVGMNGKG